jgi:serine/threonine protein kinase/tetratricopeptide (TPR) repeat protein
MDYKRKAEAVVRELKNWPDAERAAAIDALCGQDARLRREVHQLLATKGNATPDSASARTVSVDGGGSGAASRAHGADDDDDDELPDHIGRYRILRKLGQGGFGVVYLASSEEGLHRTVALKVLRPGIGDRNAIRRFQRERQILPALHHPNIAGFLDADETEEGRPYFVMEYVDGTPITEYCDKNGLTVDERVAIFEKVCDAVQHAHDRLVLHRDLKPSNILVDRDGNPKLLDFGIARLLSRDAEASADLVTIGEESALTPEYASPEQLRGDPLTVGSDVYSLGVILYELLTGQRPYYLTSRLRHAASRLVEDTRVVAPSDKLLDRQPEDGTPSGTTNRSLTTDPGKIATRRGTSIERLRRQLAGDIDNIVLTALRKEPVRRYGSARELSEDLRRHQVGDAVKARGDAWSYHAAKFVLRHRIPVAASLAVVAAGVLTTYMSFMTAKAEAAAFESRATLAEREANIARSILATVEKEEGSNRTRTTEGRRARIELAQLSLEGIGKQDDPEYAASLLNKSVAVYCGIVRGLSNSTASERDAARLAADAAIATWLRVADQPSGATRLGLGTAHLQRATLRSVLGDPDGAADDTTATMRIVADLQSDPGDLEPEARTAVRSLAIQTRLQEARQLIRRRDRDAEAAATLDQALAAAEALRQADPRNADFLENEAMAATIRAFVHERAHALPEALKLYERAMSLRKDARVLDTSSPERRERLLDSTQWCCRVLRDLGRFDEAADLLAQFENIANDVDANADFVSHYSTLSRQHELRARLAMAKADAAVAAEAFQAAVAALQEAQAFADNDDTEVRRRMAQCTVDLAEALAQRGQLADAGRHFDRAVALLTDGYALGMTAATAKDDPHASEVFAVRACGFAGRARVSFELGDAALGERNATSARAMLAEYELLRGNDQRYRAMLATAMLGLAGAEAAARGDAAYFRTQLADGGDGLEDRLPIVVHGVCAFAARGSDATAACDLLSLADSTLQRVIDSRATPPTKPSLLAARASVQASRAATCR